MDGYRLLTDAKAIDDHRVSVTFDDGTTAVFDCRPYFEMGYYHPLRNPAFFRCAHVSCGALAWPNDIDIGADDVWDESADRMRKRKADVALSRLDALTAKTGRRLRGKAYVFNRSDAYEPETFC